MYFKTKIEENSQYLESQRNPLLYNNLSKLFNIILLYSKNKINVKCW